MYDKIMIYNSNKLEKKEVILYEDFVKRVKELELGSRIGEDVIQDLKAIINEKHKITLELKAKLYDKEHDRPTVMELRKQFETSNLRYGGNMERDVGGLYINEVTHNQWISYTLAIENNQGIKESV